MPILNYLTYYGFKFLEQKFLTDLLKLFEGLLKTMKRPILLFSENLNDFAVIEDGNVQFAVCLPCEDSNCF